MNTGSTIDRQWKNTKKVWENKGYKSFGIEFIIRLVLITLPFLDIGLYLRNIFQGKDRLLARKTVTDIYVVVNMMLPGTVLFLAGMSVNLWYGYAPISVL